jgi:transcriptional regulator with XRE-family HTH domain
VTSSRARPVCTPRAREILAENLVARRHLMGWSQEALALEAGLHRTFVAHVERQARNISLDNLERVAVALGVQAYELLVPRGQGDRSERLEPPKVPP